MARPARPETKTFSLEARRARDNDPEHQLKMAHYHEALAKRRHERAAELLQSRGDA